MPARVVCFRHTMLDAQQNNIVSQILCLNLELQSLCPVTVTAAAAAGGGAGAGAGAGAAGTITTKKPRRAAGGFGKDGGCGQDAPETAGFGYRVTLREWRGMF